MTLNEAYDAIIEDTVCPNCLTIGMQPDGGFDWICPECGYEGSLED